MGKVGHTEQDQWGGECCNDRRVTTLFHDCIYNRDGETTKNGRERAHSNVGNMIGSVAIADVVELEVTVKAHEPAS